MKSEEKTASITRHVKRAGELFAHGYTARVHSIYRNTVNLLADGQLFSLQNDALPLSPMGMGVRLDEEGFAEMPIKRGHTVLFERDCLTLGGVLFTWNPEREWDPCLTERFHLGSGKSVLIKGQIAEYIKKHTDRCGFQNAALLTAGDDLFHFTAAGKIACDTIQKIRQYSESGRYVDAGEMAAELIGLGAGLTPSGDDFLIGLLSALWYLESHPHAGEMGKAVVWQIEKNLKKTNDISAALLMLACRGEFAEPFHPLYCSAFSLEAKKNVNAVGEMGHSSGVDTLSGIYLGLSLFRKSIGIR